MVDSCKYLGHIICYNLSDDADIARQYKKMSAQGNAVIREFYMCTDSVKTCLFRSYCLNLYTCQLWTNYKVESLRKMCVAYNNVFQLVFNEPRVCSASHMFVSGSLPTCKMLIRKSIHRFMKTTLNSTNNILHNIVTSDTIYASYIWQHCQNAIYVRSF